MADTIRTLSALQTLFANNTSGDISAQDLRDFLVSIGPEAARMSKSSSQTLGSGLTTVSFDTEEFDTTGDLVDLTNNRFVIQNTGIYLLSGAWLWETTSPLNSTYISFRVGSTDYVTLGRSPADAAGTGSDQGWSYSAIASLTAADNVTMAVQTNETGVTARGNASVHLRTSFAIARIGLPL